MSFLIAMFKRFIFIVTFLVCSITVCCARTVSPRQFGLDTAKNGDEVYYVLYRTHCYAIEHGCNVSYSGIDKLSIEIPTNAKSIPLSNKTDFAGCTINVLNITKDNFPLFIMDGNIMRKEVNYSGHGDVKIPPTNSLAGETLLLLINDKEPWVSNRRGYAYGAIRKDIVLVDRGRLKYETIAPYLTSDYEAKLIEVRRRKNSVSNITFVRDSQSTKKTLLFRINKTYNVSISNITVHTPENNVLYGDAVIEISNSYKVKLSKVNVDATYSFRDKYGYAISLNNIAEFKGKKIAASGNWGVFCCNNIRDITLEKCTINRFDTHCYGRDYQFNSCIFTSIGLPMSSVYGTVVFKNCFFENAKPIVYRVDYNAYTPFDVYFQGCTFLFAKGQDCLIDLAKVPQEDNPRKELREKCLPNVRIRNCSFVLDQQVERITVFKGLNVSRSIFGYIEKVEAKNVRINRDDVLFQYFDSEPLSKNTIIIKSNFQNR